MSEPDPKPKILQQTAVQCKDGCTKWIVTVEIPYVGPRGKVYSTFTTFGPDSVMDKSGSRDWKKKHDAICELYRK